MIMKRDVIGIYVISASANIRCIETKKYLMFCKYPAMFEHDVQTSRR